MPDRDEVIKGLHDIGGFIAGRIGFDQAKNFLRTIDEAIVMLKEQEAVEPIPFFTETGAESPNYVICGHCKSIKAIMPKYTKQKYCHECGFPVLWECR